MTHPQYRRYYYHMREFHSFHQLFCRFPQQYNNTLTLCKLEYREMKRLHRYQSLYNNMDYLQGNTIHIAVLLNMKKQNLCVYTKLVYFMREIDYLVWLQGVSSSKVHREYREPWYYNLYREHKKTGISEFFVFTVVARTLIVFVLFGYVIPVVSHEQAIDSHHVASSIVSLFPCALISAVSCAVVRLQVGASRLVTEKVSSGTKPLLVITI